MRYSRRKFIRVGALAAACAGLPLKSALAHSRPSGLATALASMPGMKPVQTLPSSIYQLDYYSKAAFTPYVNTNFRVYLGASNTRNLLLTEVSDYIGALAQADMTARQLGTECFSLLMTNSRGLPFQEDTYMIEHEALGTFYMFLASVNDPAKTGQQYYEAVIFRRPNAGTPAPVAVAQADAPASEVQPARNPWRVQTPKGERDIYTFSEWKAATEPEKKEEKNAPVEATWLTMAQDRGINGIKLGMTAKQVLALFPGSEKDEEVRLSLDKPVSPFGISGFVIRPQQYSTKSDFKGINLIALTLLDGRVSTFYVGFDALRAEDVDESVTKFSKGRNLPPANSWQPYEGQDDRLKTMKCKDFEINVFAGGQHTKVNYVQMLDTAAQQKLRKRIAEARKKAGE